MADTQKFSAQEANSSNDAVAKIRQLLDGVPIATAVSAVEIVRDDVHRQLQYQRAQFASS